MQILEKLSKSKNVILDCGGGILFDVDKDGREFYSEKKVKLIKIILHCIRTFA
jgi:shikimate kinase